MFSWLEKVLDKVYRSLALSVGLCQTENIALITGRSPSSLEDSQELGVCQEGPVHREMAAGRGQNGVRLCWACQWQVRLQVLVLVSLLQNCVILGNFHHVEVK